MLEVSLDLSARHVGISSRAIRCRINDVLFFQQYETAHYLFSKLRFQDRMVKREDINQLAGKVLGDLWVAIGHMGHKIYQVPQRDDAIFRRRRGRRDENLFVTFILEVLGAKFFNV